MTAVVRSYATAAELPAGWDDLTGPHDLYLTRRWLRFVEATTPLTHRYLTVESEGRPIAALPAVLLDADAPYVSSRPDSLLRKHADDPEAAAVTGAIGAADLTDRLLPSLAVGGRHVGRSRMLLAPDAARPQIDLLLQAAVDDAAAHGARSVVLPYLDTALDEPLGQALAARPGHAFGTGQYAVLPVPPAGFEAYVLSLPSGRRTTVRREWRALTEAGVVFSREAFTAGTADEMAPLEVALLRKYGTDWPVERSAAVLRQLADVLADDAILLRARIGGETVGMALALRHRSTWLMRTAGFDYDKQGRAPLYFGLLYYFGVAAAAREGVTDILYGTGSTAAKRLRGCTITDQRAHILLV